MPNDKALPGYQGMVDDAAELVQEHNELNRREHSQRRGYFAIALVRHLTFIQFSRSG